MSADDVAESGGGLGKAPSFANRRAASESHSRSKRANRRDNTEPELMMRKAIWRSGLRYRINVVQLPGKPDIVFGPSKVVVFCDGDFWHGRDLLERRVKLAKGWNGDYWVAKIERNVERDLAVNQALADGGWLVLRFWETDIRQSLDSVVDEVKRVVADRRRAR